jgi:hypothetical protein
MNLSCRFLRTSCAVILLAANACIGSTVAAAAESSSGTGFWLGCYRLTFGDDASKTRVVRLTDTAVPASPGSYAVESVPASDADLASAWRPVSATSIRIGMSNGRTGWSAELKASEDAFVGSSNWVDDTGKSGAGYIVTAKSIACDTTEAATSKP